jgi:ribosome-binding factor A
VRPFPDSAHLLVTVFPAPSAEALAPAKVLERLHRAGGLLRREVAAAIHRRRAPELLFRVALPGGAAQ